MKRRKNNEAVLNLEKKAMQDNHRIDHRSHTHISPRAGRLKNIQLLQHGND